MIKNFYFFLILFSLSTVGSAQRFDWSTSAGYPGVANSYVGAVDMATDIEGNVYVFDYANLPQVSQGVTINQNGTGMTLFVYKYSPSGELLWGESIGTNAGSLTPLNLEMGTDGRLYALVHTNTNNVITETETFSVAGPVNLILAIDPQGVVDWVKSTGFSCPTCLSLEIANDKIYYQAGQAMIRSIDFNQELQDEFSFYFDPGTAITTLPFLGSSVLSNGDLIFAGLQRGDASIFEGDTLFQVDNPFLYSNITYVRLSGDLEPIWANTFGYLHDPESHFIPVAVDVNDQIYSGWEVLNTIEIAGTVVEGDFNAWAGTLISMDSDGNPLWLRELPSNTAMRFTYLFSDHEYNRTWLSVFTGSASTIGEDVVVPDVNGSPIIASVDANGDFSSALALTGLPGSKGLSIGRGLANQYYLGGLLNNGSDYTINCIDYEGNKGLFVASFYDIPATPPTPSISAESNATLTASPAFEGVIQWFLNGEPIDGANGQSYEATVSGAYSVMYSYDFGCVGEASSVVEDVIVVGLNEENLSRLSIYPNPSSEIVWITSLYGANAVVELFDARGVLVYQNRITTSQLSLSVSDYAKGVYTMRITANDGFYSSRLIVE